MKSRRSVLELRKTVEDPNTYHAYRTKAEVPSCLLCDRLHTDYQKKETDYILSKGYRPGRDRQQTAVTKQMLKALI